ncbi:MAG: hypothetical protein AAGA73_04575 [Pseudomonadota bacterium]
MRIYALIAALALAGCQAQPTVYDVPKSQSYDLRQSDIWDRLVAVLEAEGFSIAEANPTTGRLQATLAGFQDQGWAVCKPRRVIDRHDDKNRRGRGRPVDRQLDLVADIVDDIRVNLHTNFSERQINPFKNLHFQTSCRSTGTFERLLFDRINGTPTASSERTKG